ncbi:hypothetical protein [Methylocystis sp.]|uniref:hypothetical protein n=1 Tax=Methylocystis sp. TaxID=1911079 RepID=UPI0025F42621|nr:hypothetical protein [Methylocystis sp.]
MLRAPEINVDEDEAPTIAQLSSSQPKIEAEHIPLQISGKTKPERVASWLSQTYDKRPELYVDQLLAKVQKVDSLQGATKPDLERALSRLGWQSPRKRR